VALAIGQSQPANGHLMAPLFSEESEFFFVARQSQTAPQVPSVFHELLVLLIRAMPGYAEALFGMSNPVEFREVCVGMAEGEAKGEA